MTRQAPTSLPALHRSATLERSDKKKRTVSVAFASEAPVERWFGIERLVVEPHSLDLSRVHSGTCPLLDNHDAGKVLGVVESARVDSDNVARATIRFAKSARGEEALQLVQEGVLGAGISFGYRVAEMVPDADEPDVFWVTRAEILELSIAPVPADPTVGLNRSNSDSIQYPVSSPMKPTTSPATAPETKPSGKDRRELERIQSLEYYKKKYPSGAETFERMYQAGGGDREFAAHILDNNIPPANSRSADPAPGVPSLYYVSSSDRQGMDSHQTRSVGDVIVSHEGWRALANKESRSFSVNIRGISSARELSMQTRGISTATYGQTVEGPGSVQWGTPNLQVADLIRPGFMTAHTIRVPVETAFENAAAPTLEGAEKPSQTFSLTPTDFPARKVAVIARDLTEELFSDTPAARDYLNSRLAYGVELAEEEQIINGSGIDPEMNGLLNIVGSQSQARGAMTIADALRRGISKVSSTGLWRASGIILNPEDLTELDLEKTADGNYLVSQITAPISTGGFVPTRGIWGLPIVESHAVPAGTAIVADFMRACQLFRREGLRIEAAYMGNDFAENKISVRAELRATLVCYAPQAVVQVTGLGLG